MARAAPVPGSGLLLPLGLTILLLLAVAGNWLAPTWLWGLNHGRWLAAPLRFGIPAAGLLLIWTPTGARLGSWLVGWLDEHWLGRRAVAYGLAPLLGMAVFWLLRDRTHLLGDGQTLAVMISDGKLFHGFDFMTYHLMALLHRSLGGGGEAVVFQRFAVVSCGLGGAYLGAAAWSARSLAAPGAGRALLYGLLVASPSALVFCGYAEVYAPLTVALLVTVTNLVLYRQGRTRLCAVSASLGVGLFFHLNALFLLPVLGGVLVWPPRTDPASFMRRAAAGLGPLLLALVLASLLLLLGGQDPRAYLADLVSAGGGGILQSWQGPHGLFSVRHGKDVANLVLLLVPVPVLLVMTGWRSAGRQAPWLRVMLLGSLWLLQLGAALHLKLGVVRDWDLLAPHVVLVVITGWLVAGGGDGSKVGSVLAGRSLAGLLALVLPWFLLNAGTERALARIEAVGADLAPYPQGLLHEQMAYHFQLDPAADDPEAVSRHYRLAGAVCPTNPRFHAIYGTHSLNQGDLTEASGAFQRALAADSTYVYALKMAVITAGLQRDYAGVLPLARRFKRLDYQDPVVAEAHGAAAERLGLVDEAVTAYRLAAALDPSRLEQLERAGGLLLLGRDYKAAGEVFASVLAADPAHSGAALGLANAIWQDFLARPVQQTGPEAQATLTRVIRLIDQAIADPSRHGIEVADLRAWRAEVGDLLAP